MATVIDALVMTLGLDGANFEQGTKQVNKSLDDTKNKSKEAQKEAKELEKQLTETAKKGAAAFDNIKKAAIGFFTVLLGATGLEHLVENVTEANVELGNMSKTLGVSTENLSAWGNAAEAMGGSAKTLMGDLSKLRQSVAELQLTGETGNRKYMIALGVHYDKDPLTMMKNLNHSIYQVGQHDAAKAMMLGKGAGLSEETVNLMLRSADAYEKQAEAMKKLYNPTQDDVNASIELKKQWGLLGAETKSLGSLFVSLITPALTMILRGISAVVGFMAEHQHVAEVFFGLVGAVVTLVAVGMISTLIPAVLASTAALFGMAVAGWAAMAPFLPWLLLIAAVGAAIYLIIDDFNTWRQGGESVFGYFFGKWDDAKAKMKEVASSIGGFFESMTNTVLAKLEKVAKVMIALSHGNLKGAKAAWEAPDDPNATKKTVAAAKTVAKAVIKTDIAIAKDVVGDVHPVVKAVVQAVGNGLAAVGNSGSDRRLAMLGDAISSGEGNYNSVNRGLVKVNGKNKNLGAYSEDLSKLSINDVLARNTLGFSDKNRMNAVGKYQIIASTMRELVGYMHLSGNEKLTPEMQDKLFEGLLRMKGIYKHLVGKDADIQKAMIMIAKTWASAGVPIAMMGAHRMLEAGESFYAGDGGNKSNRHSTDKIKAALVAFSQNPVNAAFGATPAQRATIGQAVRGGNTSTTDIKIGNVTIQTQATDAKGIMSDMQSGIMSHSLVSQTDTGLN